LGFVRVKAVRRMLMKLSPDDIDEITTTAKSTSQTSTYIDGNITTTTLQSFTTINVTNISSRNFIFQDHKLFKLF